MKLFTKKDQKLNVQDFTIKDLQRVSEKNLSDAISFMEYRGKWAQEGADELTDKNIKNYLSDIIVNPKDSPEIPHESIDMNDLFTEGNYEYISDGKEQIDVYIKALEEEKRKSFDENISQLKKQEYSTKSKWTNVYRLDSIDDNQNTFSNVLKAKGVKCVMIITDTFFTRETRFYKRIIDILDKNEIPYVEYTNVQPDLDRKLIFRMSEFAINHEVNSILAVGSQSIIDLSKILLAKLMKPNIFQLNRTRYFKVDPENNYSVFSIPTLVTPDPKVNSRSVIKNHIFSSKTSFFGNTLFLKGEIDDSDGVFYCIEMFDILSKEKIKQILDETFFRCIFNYFDLSATPTLKETIISNINAIRRMLDEFKVTGYIHEHNKQDLLRIISSNLDGRTIVDSVDFWIWYKLECGLSYLVNSKKSDGLALFLPSYIEVMSESSFEFYKVAIDLASKIYKTYSIDGLIYKLISHMKDHDLPIALIDIPQIRRVDYKFLSLLLKKSYLGKYFVKIHKTIVKNLTVL